MANGVVCPSCRAELEGNVRQQETVKCPECNRQFIVTANSLNAYRALQPKQMGGFRKGLNIVFGMILALMFAWYFLSPSGRMANISNQVASDAVKQYDIAKNQGDKMQICIQAGYVAATYLQAKNQSEYNTWKQIERLDCEIAGVPR